MDNEGNISAIAASFVIVVHLLLIVIIL